MTEAYEEPFANVLTTDLEPYDHLTYTLDLGFGNPFTLRYDCEFEKLEYPDPDDLVLGGALESILNTGVVSIFKTEEVPGITDFVNELSEDLIAQINAHYDTSVVIEWIVDDEKRVNDDGIKVKMLKSNSDLLSELREHKANAIFGAIANTKDRSSMANFGCSYLITYDVLMYNLDKFRSDVVPPAQADDLIAELKTITDRETLSSFLADHLTDKPVFCLHAGGTSESTVMSEYAANTDDTTFIKYENSWSAFLDDECHVYYGVAAIVGSMYRESYIEDPSVAQKVYAGFLHADSDGTPVPKRLALATPQDIYQFNTGNVHFRDAISAAIEDWAAFPAEDTDTYDNAYDELWHANFYLADSSYEQHHFPTPQTVESDYPDIHDLYPFGTLARLLANRQLRVGRPGFNPGFHMPKTPGGLGSGFDELMTVGVAAALREHYGMRMEVAFVDDSFNPSERIGALNGEDLQMDAVVQQLETPEFDLLVGSTTVSEERNKYVNFGRNYIVARTGAVTWYGNPCIDEYWSWTWDELATPPACWPSEAGLFRVCAGPGSNAAKQIVNILGDSIILNEITDIAGMYSMAGNPTDPSDITGLKAATCHFFINDDINLLGTLNMLMLSSQLCMNLSLSEPHSFGMAVRRELGEQHNDIVLTDRMPFYFSAGVSLLVLIMVPVCICIVRAYRGLARTVGGTLAGQKANPLTSQQMRVNRSGQGGRTAMVNAI
eukprot:gnl/Dysnectes_brevis/2040_a2357_1218.p1 GENE.gnl/Dysnectes_brevis/2040_a2357_1218~~gnl/Dysnectes_brevis/2040_a2357_1218.p1  ORF type:complete len:792 (-),score=228.96 gnl/Dysnectes_brevis/2040_a2357_1218:113-2275(-)